MHPSSRPRSRPFPAGAAFGKVRRSDITRPRGAGMRSQVVVGLVVASTLSGIAAADPGPIGPGDPTWAIRTVLGYTKTGGNTDNSAGNFLFHAAHLIGDWKLLFGTEGLYGSTRGETTAQAWDAHGQANYNFSSRFFWYVGLSYTDDRFSGFAFQ